MNIKNIKNIKYQLSVMSIALLVTFLTACGGGGSDGASDGASTTGGGTTGGGTTGDGTTGGGTTGGTDTSEKSGSIIEYADFSPWNDLHHSLTMGDSEELIVADGKGDGISFVAEKSSYAFLVQSGSALDFIGDEGSRGVAFNRKDKKLYYIDSDSNLYKISMPKNIAGSHYEVSAPELVNLSATMPNLDTSGNPINSTGKLQDIDIDKNGNIFLATSSYILKVTPNQTITVAFVGRDRKNNNIDAIGLAVADDGTVYFTTKGGETRNSDEADLVKKIDKNGVVSFFAGHGDKGFKDGKGEAAHFDFVTYGSGIGSGLAVYENNVYIADSQNLRIRKITPDGTVTTYAGGGDKHIAIGGTPRLEGKVPERPLDVVISSKGDVYFSTLWGGNVYKIRH